MSTPPGEILTVRDLKKHFVVGRTAPIGGEPITVRAVDGVSFGMAEGQTFGLVGESGSGKSTVAYTIAGMYQPTAGDILFRGRSLFANGRVRPRQLRKEIQIVFQDPGSSLNPRRTVQQILELPLRLHQPERRGLEEVVGLLEMVGLPPEFMHKYPRALGGGEKQAVAIARALATNPSFLILDEPTSALDVSAQGKIINLLLRLQEELKLTYLFITHDLSLMRNVASRVAIMYLGKIAEIARIEEFFRRPQHPYTQMLLSSIPVISEEEERLRPRRIVSTGEIPSPVNVPSGCSFRTRCPHVMDVCVEVDPPFFRVGEGHVARCHLYADQPEVAAEAVERAGEVSIRDGAGTVSEWKGGQLPS